MRRRYIVELGRTADDHIEGLVRRDGAAEAVRFSGWLELMSLIEPLPAPEPGHDQPAQRRAVR